MRGKHRGHGVGDVARRIIPAHAGQTCRVCMSQGSGPDHPRACGANHCAMFREISLPGSSPRMRGKRIRESHTEGRRRIIPAHAGQTRFCPVWVVWAADHPRACGANGTRLISARPLGGSSPRMRGKPDGSLMITSPSRIIPAHAGQTHYPNTHQPKQPDHPRACGANTYQKITNPSVCDHPRACGANRATGEQPQLVCRSSPRMRGKHAFQLDIHNCFPIIPAHAGQTSSMACINPRWADHPRACGANQPGARA